MFNPGDYVVVSGYGVCRVDSVGQLSLSCADRGRDYYTLNPVNDECTIHIPCDSDAGHMRPLVTKADAVSLIRTIPSIKVRSQKDKLRTVRYREAISDGRPEVLLPVIMEIYQLHSSSISKGKPICNVTEASMLREAERLFNSEIGQALGCEASAVPDFIKSTLKNCHRAE